MSTSPINARLACGSLRNDGAMLTTSMLGICAKRSRIWSRVVAGDAEMRQELEWLKQHVYSGRSARVELETTGGKVRYSNRLGHKEVVTL